MAHGDLQGYARTDPRAPRAKGVCDQCGFWFQRRSLIKQTQWNGTAIVWQGTLVCRRCFDVPQAQLKAIRLPPDPVPIKNPRPEYFSIIDMPLGFTQYSMWPSGQPLNYGVELMDGSGNPILTGDGQPILIEVGSDGIALLAQLSEITGIPVPGDIQVYNSTIALAGVTQALIPASATRTYIAIFNPCTAPIFVSTATAAPGVAPAISIGPGGCLFWATAQGYGTPYAGAMTVVGNIAGGVPYYCYGN